MFSIARSSLAWVGRGQLADLVEEDRPPPGRDEQPGVVAIGPGEGAPDVAEELVLQQVVRDRRAVDRQEQPRPASGPGACRARATSSLPVPDSPVIRTLLRVGPTLRISVLTACIAGLSPTSGLEVALGVELAPQRLVLAAAAGDSRIRRSILASSSSKITGFIR